MNENIFVIDKTVSEKKFASDLVYLKRKTDVGYYFNAIIKNGRSKKTFYRFIRKDKVSLLMCSYH